MSDIEELLNRFPKTRPALPPEYRAIFESMYRENRDGATPATALAQWMERWLHRQTAADGGKGATLEIGAGTLNHLPYEPNATPYDIIEPFHALLKGRALLSRVRNRYDDIRQLPRDAYYERIIAIATFEHLVDLPEVIAHAGARLLQHGVLRVAIPAEGTPLWRWGWQLTTGPEFRRRYGLDYAVLVRSEHVNTAAEINDVLRYFFADVKRRVFGLSPYWSVYHFLECRKPDLQRCATWAQLVREPLPLSDKQTNEHASP